MTQTHSTVQVAPAMRWLLVGAVALVVLAGIPLFFLSASTEQYFAWTIQPPLTGKRPAYALTQRLERLAPQGATEGSLFVPADDEIIPLS